MKMKSFLSQMILIVCILTIGGIGLFSMTEQSEAHPKRLDYRHSTYWCHEKDGELYVLCGSWTESGSRAVWPWKDHWKEEGNHKKHAIEKNKHSYDNESYEVTSCSKC